MGLRLLGYLVLLGFFSCLLPCIESPLGKFVSRLDVFGNVMCIYIISARLLSFFLWEKGQSPSPFRKKQGPINRGKEFRLSKVV